MSQFEILNTEDRWNAALKDFGEDVDIYFIFSFFQVYAKQYNAIPEAAFLKTDRTKIFYPYLVRSIADVPSFSDKMDLKDITTPYGYGGPLVSSKDQDSAIEDMATFRNQFEEHAKDQKFITEFIRFHPSCGGEEYFKPYMEIVQAGSVALTDLNLETTELFARFAKDKQRGIKKAEKAGVEVFFKDIISNEDITEFLLLYEETMDRNSAEEKYYFDKKQIVELVQNLAGHLLLVKAIYESKTISSYLVFKSGGFLTNYLSSSSASAHHLYPKNKVIWELIKYGHEQGMKVYNLGGGKPSLLQFKSGFGGEVKPFYLGKRIFDPDMYELLIHKAQLSETEKNFFPAYRHSRLYGKLM
jgi:hypothetical protein